MLTQNDALLWWSGTWCGCLMYVAWRGSEWGAHWTECSNQQWWKSRWLWCNFYLCELSSSQWSEVASPPWLGLEYITFYCWLAAMQSLTASRPGIWHPGFLLVLVPLLNWKAASYNLHLTLLFWKKCSHTKLCLVRFIFFFFFTPDCSSKAVSWVCVYVN